MAIAPSGAPPSAFVVWRGIEDSVRRAAALGYQGVELALREASDVDADRLAVLLEETGLEVSCISTGQVFAVSNLYFTHPDPACRDQVVEVFAGLTRLAARLGRTLNVGRARGFVGPGQTRAEAEALFVDTARRICDDAAPFGVTLLIEPVNRYEINLVNNLDEGAELLDRVERSNVGLMPDVFHMNIEDARIGEALARHGQWVKYIHLADSNRHAPGQGHLDFEDVFTGLGEAGFDGWGSVEILPLPDPDTAARQAAEAMLPRIEAYNVSRAEPARK